ncbi:restriction endonuclease subunit S (plasmid) [Pediococcus argentinicus]|uniref:restriction endonuclease subunit S n=1 Tax=Pediococcus argentinicus TaxID=480391 RepID=UPI00338D53F1
MKDKQTKYPQLRFNGFTDPWEERKLGEIFNYEQPTKYIVKSTEYDDTFNTPVLTAGKSFLLGYTDEITGIKNATVENPVVIFDDFTTGSHYVDFPFKIKSSAMKLLSLNDNSDNFYFMFNTLKNIKYVPQSHERHWISKFSEFEIYKPSQEEQQKIGSFFKQLDDTIALHQRKLDLLKEQKKGYLQKMFPKNGAKVPELRFAGFAGDWEERKLGEHSNILTGGTPKTSMSNYWNPKEIPWMSSGEVNKRRINETDNMISKEGLENSSARWVKENSIVIALAGQGKTRGTVAVNNIPLTTNQSIAAIEPDETLNFEFIFQNLSKRYDELRMMSSGDGTRGGLNKKIIDEIIIAAPILEEQKKIGSFFKQLDNTITLHQRKLEKLQELKKGYLQKMFC